MSAVALRPLEEVRIVTVLGIRFWDAARDSQVSDGLVVSARAEGTTAPRVTAFRTLSGVYAFQGLPGLHDLEYPPPGATPAASPPLTARLIVEVEDTEDRFVPVAFAVEVPLPYRGVLTTAVGGSPPFDVHVGARACFVAKIHQAGRVDQRTNSYHLMWEPTGLAYLAKHHHVFKRVALAREAWERIRLVYRSGLLECHRNEELLFRLPHRELPRGFAVLAVKGGEVRLRNVTLSEPREAAPPGGDEAIRLRDFTTRFDPRVSIVTTVYDRVECLRRCLRSVKKLLYRDYEQIVVADAPPPDVLAALTAVVEQEDDGRVCFLTLGRRVNNWGIAPAAAGLARARGAYLCFLSDDNGYTPDHLDHLVRALDGDPGLGFAYSSCRYDGRMLLTSPVPRPGGIDLGQPIFRRELFARYLNDGLPFGVAAWDWQLVETFMRNRVRWKHVNRPTFLFRLAKYRQFAG